MKASIAAVEKKESKISEKHERLASALKLQGDTTKCYLRGFRRVCEYFDRLPDYLSSLRELLLKSRLTYVMILLKKLKNRNVG